MSVLIPTGQAPRVRAGGFVHPEVTAGIVRPCYDWLWSGREGAEWPALPPAEAPTHGTEWCYLVACPTPDFAPDVTVLCHLWDGNGAVQSEVKFGPGTKVTNVGVAPEAGLVTLVPVGIVAPDGSVDRKAKSVDVWAELHRFIQWHA